MVETEQGLDQESIPIGVGGGDREVGKGVSLAHFITPLL